MGSEPRIRVACEHDSMMLHKIRSFVGAAPGGGLWIECPGGRDVTFPELAAERIDYEAAYCAVGDGWEDTVRNVIDAALGLDSD